jgi:hypothetical protein
MKAKTKSGSDWPQRKALSFPSMDWGKPKTSTMEANVPAMI